MNKTKTSNIIVIPDKMKALLELYAANVEEKLALDIAKRRINILKSALLDRIMEKALRMQVATGIPVMARVKTAIPDPDNEDAHQYEIYEVALPRGINPFDPVDQRVVAQFIEDYSDTASWDGVAAAESLAAANGYGVKFVKLDPNYEGGDDTYAVDPLPDKDTLASVRKNWSFYEDDESRTIAEGIKEITEWAAAVKAGLRAQRR